MRYELLYSTQAQSDLGTVPDELLDQFEAQITRLAKHPATLSRRSVFPYPEGFQIYQFDLFDLSGDRHVYTIFFRYAVDERSHHIAKIGHGQYADPADD